MGIKKALRLTTPRGLTLKLNYIIIQHKLTYIIMKGFNLKFIIVLYSFIKK